MVLDDVPTDGQTQTCAAWLVGQGIAHLLELFENALLIGCGHPDASVRNGNAHLVVDNLAAQHDRAAWPSELHRVVEQVGDHLMESVTIAEDPGQVLVQADVERQLCQRDERTERSGQVGEQLGHVDAVHLPVHVPGFDAAGC